MATLIDADEPAGLGAREDLPFRHLFAIMPQRLGTYNMKLIICFSSLQAFDRLSFDHPQMAILRRTGTPKDRRACGMASMAYSSTGRNADSVLSARPFG